MTAYIGTAVSRVDGRAKVTGAATYAGDVKVASLAFGSVVTSQIATGRIKQIDAQAAIAVDGVLAVLTHLDRPHMASEDSAYKDDVAPEVGSPFRPLYDDKIHFSRQPIALVIAEESEVARFAASLVHATYEETPYLADVFSPHPEEVVVQPGSNPFAPPRSRGAADQAFAAARLRHSAEYYVPIEHHNPMEPYASTVIYEADGRLTIHDKTQGVQNVQRYVAHVLEMNPADVRVLSPFVGGAFGSGLRPQYQVVLAALGALALRRSVRVVLTRAQMYGLGFRPATIHQIGLGANAAGALDAVTHKAITTTSRNEDFHRQETGWSGLLYNSPHARYAHSLVRVDLPTPCDMRAPSAAPSVYALEAAMDELAVALTVDPIELRLRCYSDRDQHTGNPYSSKALRECFQQGAAAFGWEKRSAAPRAMRDGSELIGWGMASGVWEALQVPITVRIVLTANGHAEILCATSDIGTGTHTIMAQVAAELLGLPIDGVTIRLGDSTLPQSPVEGGSWIAASVANGIANTAGAVQDELLSLAKRMPHSPLADTDPADVMLADGAIASRRDASRRVSIADALRHGKVDRIDLEKTVTFEDDGTQAHNTHSAVFAEVKVDEQLGVVRVTRVVSAVAAGRILNTKTATSQIMGGVVWGIGMALHEQTLVDRRFGRIMNADFAEYHVPVNADVHDIDVIFVDEPDTNVNPMGVKGLGEIGIVGVAAAVANAVYHATGVRVRGLPITLDKLQR
ncbi:MAG TPA: xanthine dehydrogenase family protein molybdopterin-binding subunit [Acetobacteraceae bacterium]|nr:xanthine dehydrogenase family protein molybdopterin-binding subunit [Acetobacteraceae bacterium]